MREQLESILSFDTKNRPQYSEWGVALQFLSKNKDDLTSEELQQISQKCEDYRLVFSMREHREIGREDVFPRV